MQLKPSFAAGPTPLRLLAVLLLGTLVAAAAAAEQPPITAAELDRFIRTWPRYTELASRDASAGTVVERWGWQLDRFLYVAGRVASGLVQLESEAPGADDALPLEDRTATILESEHLTQQQKDRLIARIMAERRAGEGEVENADGEAEADGTVDDTGEADESDLALIRERREELQRVMGLAY